MPKTIAKLAFYFLRIGPLTRAPKMIALLPKILYNKLCRPKTIIVNILTRVIPVRTMIEIATIMSIPSSTKTTPMTRILVIMVTWRPWLTLWEKGWGRLRWCWQQWCCNRGVLFGLTRAWLPSIGCGVAAEEKIGYDDAAKG